MAGGLSIMALSATAHVADYGDSINRILGLGTDRAARRNLHGIAGLIGSFLVLVGWLVAWVVHEYKHASHIAADDPAYVQVGVASALLMHTVIHARSLFPLGARLDGACCHCWYSLSSLHRPL